jgi:pimeloyl-ACP methyl ester carboxylesterase
VALQRRIFETMREDGIESRIAGLATPTLIVWGADDRVFHAATAGILRGLLPNSQVVVMPGVGHVPMMERPRQCAEDYLRFRASLPGDR